MAHPLNTNKQFMIGNAILAFAVIFVVVIFVYMSLQLQQKQKSQRRFLETYTICLTQGFANDSISLFINDSLLRNFTVRNEPCTLKINRFEEHSALMIVNNQTDEVYTFDLSEKGGSYHFMKNSEGDISKEEF